MIADSGVTINTARIDKAPTRAAASSREEVDGWGGGLGEDGWMVLGASSSSVRSGSGPGLLMSFSLLLGGGWFVLGGVAFDSMRLGRGADGIVMG